MSNLSPIVLFVYNRLWHTDQTIKALQKNELAKESELFIYADNANSDDALEQVTEVRNYIKNIKGFKKLTIIERETNYGLANSIIDGVTKIINKYGKIIVLEDDIVTSPYFLNFMNKALNFYQNEQKVWHISGWNYPIETDGLDDVFLWRLMNCWGWATWSENWKYFEKNIDKTIDTFKKNDIKIFNLDGVAKGFWNQVILNKKDKISTWAIFWYVSIFKQNGLCLNPSQTFVHNIGLDGSGKHCNDSMLKLNNLSLNKKSQINFNIDIIENNIGLDRVKKFYKTQKKPFLLRAVNKLFRIIFAKKTKSN